MQEFLLHLCLGDTSDACEGSDKSDIIDRVDGFFKHRIISEVSDRTSISMY